MGVQGLYPFLKTKAPAAHHERPLSSFAGSTIAVDVSIFVYQICRAYQLHNSLGELTNHVRGMASVARRLRDAGVKPIFMFDGTPHELKAATLAKRAAAVAASSFTPLGRAIFDDVWHLLTSLGYTCLRATGEAEAACAALCTGGFAQAVATEDSDALLFGADVVRGLTKSTGVPTLIVRGEVLATLGLTQSQFVQFAILLGTDYSPRVLGPATALKKYAQHPPGEVHAYYMDAGSHLPIVFELAPVPPTADTLSQLKEWLARFEYSDKTVTAICESANK
jgi:flap endonuclease-1